MKCKQLLLLALLMCLQKSLNAHEQSAYPRRFAPYYSQCGQDKYINENLFHNKRNGIFIEIGAHDGISFSNAYYFEKELGWQGICIEPHPDRFAELIKNRAALCIQACVSNYNGTSQFLKISGAPDMLSGLYDAYDKRHLARIELELTRFGGSKELIEVPVINFNELLVHYGITSIDFLSCDTEGNELAILSSIDFATVDIDVIVVEDNYEDKKIYNYLLSKGYRYLIKLEGDEIYQKIRY